MLSSLFYVEWRTKLCVTQSNCALIVVTVSNMRRNCMTPVSSLWMWSVDLLSSLSQVQLALQNAGTLRQVCWLLNKTNISGPFEISKNSFDNILMRLQMQQLGHNLPYLVHTITNLGSPIPNSYKNKIINIQCKTQHYYTIGSTLLLQKHSQHLLCPRNWLLPVIYLCNLSLMPTPKDIEGLVLFQ